VLAHRAPWPRGFQPQSHCTRSPNRRALGDGGFTVGVAFCGKGRAALHERTARERSIHSHQHWQRRRHRTKNSLAGEVYST